MLRLLQIRGELIQVGDVLPDVSVWVDSSTNCVRVREFFANKTAVIFAVPGAFTPVCDQV